MDGSRFSLNGLRQRTSQVSLKQKTINRHQAKSMVKAAFPSVSYSENRFINVKGNKSPFDGDLNYWAKRNSALYDGIVAKTLRKQNHSCGYCGLKFALEEMEKLIQWDLINLSR